MPHGIYTNKKCKKTQDMPFIPQEQQSAVLDYFLNKLPYKGLLLFHKLGSGKSCSSILIADEMLRIAKVSKVFVLSKAGLRDNFITEYCARCGFDPSFLSEYYHTEIILK